MSMASFPVCRRFLVLALGFSGVKPKEACSRCSEMAADGKHGRAGRLRLAVDGGLFIGPCRSILHPSPSYSTDYITGFPHSLASLLGWASGSIYWGQRVTGDWDQGSQGHFRLATPSLLQSSAPVGVSLLRCSPPSSSRSGDSNSNSSPEMLVLGCCTILLWFP